MAKRPFKIDYYMEFPTGNKGKVGRRVACSSPEAVIRSTSLALLANRADGAKISFEEEPFALMVLLDGCSLRFTVF